MPTFFATFSAAETKWKDLLNLLYKKNHNKEVSDDKITYMQKAELIQKGPVTCARHFQYPTHIFFNNILTTSASPIGKVVDYYYRVEFQNRGSPHLHCIFWVENSPIYDEASEENVIKFIDQHITCSKITNTESDEYTYLQTHKHTNSCKKTGKRECRFGFPLPSMKCTCILEPLAKDIDQQELKKTSRKQQISQKDLKKKCNLTENDYLLGIRSSLSKKQVFFKRNPTDVRMNGYNPAILQIWAANTDLQYVLDPWALCVYIASYIMKSQRGISKLLKSASDEAKKR